MEQLNKTVVSVIPENWLEQFDQINTRFGNVQGYLQLRSSVLNVSVIGGKFKENIGSLDLTDQRHELSCRFANCDAKIRIFGELQSIVGSSTDIVPFERDVELCAVHTCIYGLAQRKTLAYMESLRVYLMKHENRRLNSFTGFYIYQPGYESENMVNAPFAILTHLFEPERKRGDYAHCQNNRLMVCNSQRNSKEYACCNTIVTI